MKITVDVIRVDQSWDANTGAQQNFLVISFAGKMIRVPCSDQEVVAIVRQLTSRTPVQEDNYTNALHRHMQNQDDQAPGPTFHNDDHSEPYGEEMEEVHEDAPVNPFASLSLGETSDRKTENPTTLRKEMINQQLSGRQRLNSREASQARLREVARKAPYAFVSDDDVNRGVESRRRAQENEPAVIRKVTDAAPDDDLFEQG